LSSTSRTSSSDCLLPEFDKQDPLADFPAFIGPWESWPDIPPVEGDAAPNGFSLFHHPMEEWNENHGRKLSPHSPREDNEPLLVVAVNQGLLQRTSNHT